MDDGVVEMSLGTVVAGKGVLALVVEGAWRGGSSTQALWYITYHSRGGCSNPMTKSGGEGVVRNGRVWHSRRSVKPTTRTITCNSINAGKVPGVGRLYTEFTRR